MISGPLITAERAVAMASEAVFLDARARPGAREAFEQSHALGALYVDLETDLSEVGDPRQGGRHPLPPLDAWLHRVGSWGVATSTPVLIYDADDGGMAAARAWWMFHAIGHKPLAVVDGGWAALQRAGIPTERGEARVPTGARYATSVREWPTVDADFVESVRNDSSWRLIDARAPGRYAGEVEPIDPVAGHIPGALNLYWRSQVDEAGKLIDRTALRSRYEALLGDIGPERAVCYCGSGVTACHLLLAMEACGMPGAQLYVGSWSEWCRTRGGAI
ncbi:MAG: sulfurtransferase [Myxococcales bacterium]|nr:MAG: sulfurtransferase [Myxococcales bacterium]